MASSTTYPPTPLLSISILPLLYSPSLPSNSPSLPTNSLYTSRFVKIKQKLEAVENQASLQMVIVHVYWHPGMLRHDQGRGVFDSLQDPGFLEVLDAHPENADRVKNMVSILEKGPISPFLSWHLNPPPALPSHLLTFHTPDYIQELINADANGGKLMCPGTMLNPGSWDAALLAAGCTLQAMQDIVEGQVKIAYALVRPPGHHAQPSQADGYCFLNNAGLAIQRAIDLGCKTVAVIDIDVHYGNGTAEGFYKRDDVLTISLHMKHGSWGPSHPQTGLEEEIGKGKGIGFNLNIPLPNGTGNAGYEYAMEKIVVPALHQFKPEMIVFVIGQDSSAFDPNGRQCLTMAGYWRLGQIVREQAELHSCGKLLIVQEGGYHLTYSAYCLHATLEGALNLESPLLLDPLDEYPEDILREIEEIEIIKEKWEKACRDVKGK